MQTCKYAYMHTCKQTNDRTNERTNKQTAKWEGVFQCNTQCNTVSQHCPCNFLSDLSSLSFSFIYLCPVCLCAPTSIGAGPVLVPEPVTWRDWYYAKITDFTFSYVSNVRTFKRKCCCSGPAVLFSKVATRIVSGSVVPVRRPYLFFSVSHSLRTLSRALSVVIWLSK